MSRPIVVAALCLALAPSAISAEPDAEAVVRYRHALFHTLGAQMMGIGMIAKGAAGTPDDLIHHATVLHETALIVGHAFPAGTGPDVVPHTRALPAIWSDAKGFDAAWQRLVSESAKLVKVAKKKDVEATSAQLGKVGAACGGCHEAFRGPEHEEHDE